MTMNFGFSFPDSFAEIYNKFHKSEKGKKLLELEGLSREHMDIPVMSKGYFTEDHTADVSIDSNANANASENKNFNNYTSEITKPIMKLENYYLIFRELEKTHGKETAQDLLTKIIDGTYYFHDSTAVQIPYCYAFATSRLMTEGRQWGQLKSLAPKRAKSFMAQVIETVMDLSQEFAGAVTPADMIVNYSYYAKKEKLSRGKIEQDFQSFIHIVNNTYRTSGQSPFTNISIFDSNNLKLMFEGYMFPDGTKPDFDYIMKLQDIFANFFSKGDPANGGVYRFPVVTFTMLIDKNKKDENGNLLYPLDSNFLDMVSKYNYKKANFNIYLSNSAGKVCSCCRLTNDFSQLTGINSFGAGAAISIGSHRVVSLNLPRLAIEHMKNNEGYDKDSFFVLLDEWMEDVHKLLKSHRSLLHKRANAGFLKFINPLSFGSIDKHLFSTFGINGQHEMMHYLTNGDMYDEKGILKQETIELEKEIMEYINDTVMGYSKEEKLPYNLEEVPGESLAVKFAAKDKVIYGEDQIFDIYSNQFVPLSQDIDIFDRIDIEAEFGKSLSGGSIVHINMKSPIKCAGDMKKIVLYALERGLEHFAVNYSFNVCENGHNTVGGIHDEKCPECGSQIVQKVTRVVGYFTPVEAWNKVRRESEIRIFK